MIARQFDSQAAVSLSIVRPIGLVGVEKAGSEGIDADARQQRNDGNALRPRAKTDEDAIAAASSMPMVA